jgi:hypothetical protein
MTQRIFSKIAEDASLRMSVSTYNLREGMAYQLYKSIDLNNRHCQTEMVVEEIDG